MITHLILQIPLVAFAGLMVWAAVNDATRFTIPNRIPAAVAALWVAYAAARLIAGVPVTELAWALGFGLAAFAVGTVMFAMRWFGGGDVKLLAAVMLWAGPQLGLPFLFVAFLLGGLLALVVLAARVMRDMRDSAAAHAAGGTAQGIGSGVGVVFTNALKTSVPFGVAIAAGGLFVFYRLMFGL